MELKKIEELISGLDEETAKHIKSLFVVYGSGGSFAKPVHEDWDRATKCFMVSVKFFAHLLCSESIDPETIEQINIA